MGYNDNKILEYLYELRSDDTEDGGGVAVCGGFGEGL